MLNSENIQTAAFFARVLVFEILERVRPEREVDRWKELKIDVFSFALAITMNRISHYSVTGFVNACAPAWMLGGWHALQGLPGTARIVLAIFLVDFMIYWIHRAQHRFDPLWRTHAWHHSVEQLYWFSGFRTSFLHSFIYNIPQVVIPILLLKLSPAEAGIGYAIGLLIQFWEHTNFKADVGWLGWLLVTPDYHRIHHSATRHRGKNLGTTFRL